MPSRLLRRFKKKTTKKTDKDDDKKDEERPRATPGMTGRGMAERAGRAIRDTRRQQMEELGLKDGGKVRRKKAGRKK